MLTVCNYHYIREEFSFKYPSIFGVTPLAFENQLHTLKKSGDFISSSDLQDNTNSILESNNNYILITFDDGLKEQFTHALPILESKGIPAVFFVNTINYLDCKVSTVHKIHLLRSIVSAENLNTRIESYDIKNLTQIDKEIAKKTYRFDNKATAELKFLLNFKIPFKKQEIIINDIFNDYFVEEALLNELYMSTEELKHLGKLGYLGSHTHSHYPLGLLDNSLLDTEFNKSKSYLEALTGLPINTVSYPYGTPEACTNNVFSRALKANYKLGFTTTTGINRKSGNNLSLMRYDCNDLPGGKNFKE